MKLSLLSIKGLKTKASKKTLDLKLKRNVLNFEQYKLSKSKEEQINSSFYKNFVTDAQSKSIPIAKAIFNNNPKLAAKEYTQIIKEYTLYLKKSGINDKYLMNYLTAFKQRIFKSLTSIIKKEVPKKVVRKQSLLSEKKIKEISGIEDNLLKDLFNLGLIKDTSKINIRYSEINAIEAISDLSHLDDNPSNLFKQISYVYFSLKEGKRNESANDLIKGLSRKIKVKNNQLNNSISINTFHKNSNHIIIHELIHSYLKRENHKYSRNEVVVEFLSNLLSKKYFKEEYRRNFSNNFEKNQYYIGFSLYNEYTQKYGLDFKHVNNFLKSKENVIKNNSFNFK